MKFQKRYSGVNNPKSMFIIVGAIIVIGVGILLLTSLSNKTPGAALMEGSDYEIEYVDQGKYQIVDDEGNIIELKRITSEVYLDSNGKRYIFVSGSPYRFVGMD